MVYRHIRRTNFDYIVMHFILDSTAAALPECGRPQTGFQSGGRGVWHCAQVFAPAFNSLKMQLGWKAWSQSAAKKGLSSNLLSSCRTKKLSWQIAHSKSMPSSQITLATI